MLIKKLVLKTVLFFFVFITLNLYSLDQTSDEKNNKPKSIIISKVESVVENIDLSFWSSDFKYKRSCGISFFIYFEGDIQREDLQSCEVHNRYSNWTINLDNCFIKSSKSIGTYVRYYDTNLSKNFSVMTIGEYKVVLKPKYGNVINYTFIVSAPGSKKNEGYEFVYNKDYHGIKNVKFIQSLDRANIEYFEKIKEYFFIDFNINDERVSNGYVWFYDRNDKYIGTSKFFVNNFSKEVNSILNNGTNFFKNGRTNKLIISENDINFSKDAKLNDVYKIRIALTDGYQYFETQNKDKIDYRSISKDRNLTEKQL
jgi:hypothetical protein